jgi:hypothetical protein
MFGIGAVIRALSILAIVLVVVAGGYYIINLKANLAVSEMNNKMLEQGIADQRLEIQKMQQDISAIQKANADLAESSNRARADVIALQEKFSQDARGQSRDFGVLAKERPDLIQRLVNRGTRNAMRCLEIASGAARTPEEIAAVTSSEINKECPSIANPNYKAPQ